MGRFRLAQALRELRPMRQGDLDGLCGLYAIINAVQLVVFPTRLRRPQLKRLFAAGAKALADSDHLVTVATGGISDERWMHLCEQVVEEASKLVGERIIRSRLLPDDGRLGRNEVLRTIRCHVGRGRPVLVAFWPRLNHWTVIAGYSRRHFKLFDSHDLKWVSVELVSVDDTGDDRPHQVAHTAAAVLHMEPRSDIVRAARVLRKKW